MRKIDKNTNKNILINANNFLVEEKGKNDSVSLSAMKKKSLIHKLQAHQLELEMQNEELRRVSKEIQETKNKYSELYELERSKRLSDIGALSAAVAHELRNPLAAIGLAIANVKRKAANTSLIQHLTNIEKKVAESDKIINNLLYYSRIKPPHYEKINICDIIKECVETTQKHSKKKISFKVKLTAIKDIFIEADSLQMLEIFSNIFNNAYDAISGNNGKIETIGIVEDGFIKIFITDDGVGIHKNSIDRVFDPFFTTKAKGIGLGLTICQQIIGLHNGSIYIDSESENGTTVVVSIPKNKDITANK